MVEITNKKQIIKEIVNQEQSISINALIKKTKIPRSTLMRFIEELKIEKFLTRYHGGVQININELTEESKININWKEKQLIAKIAVSKIEWGDVLFLDAGSTTATMAMFINQRNITVFTNSIKIASILNKKINYLYLIGGRINQSTGAIVGSGVIQQLTNIRITKAFLGCNYYDDKYFYTTNSYEAAIKSLAARQSDKTFVLSTANKSNQKSKFPFLKMNKATLITEEG